MLNNGTVIPMALAASLLFVVAFAAYRVSTAPDRAEDKLGKVIEKLNAATKSLSEAEKMGHFGSFTWNYEDSSSSFWSDEMYEIFGLIHRRTTPDPESFVTSAHEQDRASVKQEWDKARSKAGPFSLNFRVASRNSGIRNVRVQGATMLDTEHKPWKIHGVAHDVTREAEIDRSKTEFVSLASHQLKTPLTSIRWLAEALNSGSLGPLLPAQKNYMENIQMSVQRMIDMVNDLLTVSRIELGKMARHIEELDAVEMAKNVIEEQRHDAETRELTLTFASASALPHVFADKISLRHVFQNLVSNAIKYTPAKGTVTVRLELGGVKTESLFLTVSDTGIGIPKKEYDNVFEKLHRASNAQALVPDGTGLGLYVVKTVIDKAGGGITFESVEGKGTTFYVTIPIHWKNPDGTPNNSA